MYVMHVRASRVTRNGKTYEYAQLVESFRRPDGMPAHRVVASFRAGSLDVENLRLALEATRMGRRVHVGRSRALAEPAPQPVANLRYLDVAVLLELWRAWGLDELLAAALGPSGAAVAAESVIAVLSIQRCVDPGSKLYATRWISRTALPELLGIPVDSFNNTRLHRVLDDLDRATPSLMSRLAERYQAREGSFAVLFMDATDVWFVGEGPALAERGKTKEGRVERKVGLVLLCNEHGYPMRWEVIAGRESEIVAMSRMVEHLAGVRWAQRVPLVCDRAMGRTAQVRKMLEAGLHFLTALTITEFDAYTDRVPHASLADLQPSDGAGRDRDLAEASRRIEQAGLVRIEDNLLVLDLGIVERVGEPPSADPAQPNPTPNGIAHVMQLARAIDADVAAGRFSSYASAGSSRGLRKQLVAKYRQLRRLPEAIQLQILDGQARDRSLDELIRIARLADEPQQHHAFAALIASARPGRASARSLGIRAPSSNVPLPPVRVRAVLYFNPQIFVDERLRAHDRIQTVHAFVADLNRRLASPASRLGRDQIAAAIDRHLRKDNLVEVFQTHITENDIAGRKKFQVRLSLDEPEWSRRCRYHGFSVLVAHPDLAHPAAALCRLYRAKDAIEKDFFTIKSVVELRPVWHHTDAKVRAHVTLCMLALLLERTLARKLAGTCSARAALELLASAHLNRYLAADGSVTHVVTRTDPDQNQLLRRLRLQHLAHYQEVAAPSSVP